MELTYDDIENHQDILKNMLKSVEPNLYSCFTLPNWNNHTLFINENYSISKVGCIFLGIRTTTANFNTCQAADIFSNRIVQNTLMPDELFNATQTWILLVETAKQRHYRRIQAFKKELLEHVWHPDNLDALESA